MIAPVCDRCGSELKDFGGILLGPPDASGMVRKRHLCGLCYQLVETLFAPTNVVSPARVVARRYRPVTHPSNPLLDTWEEV